MLEVRLRLSAHNSLLEMVKVDAMRQMQHRARGQTFLAQFLAGDHQGVNFSKESLLHHGPIAVVQSRVVQEVIDAVINFQGRRDCLHKIRRGRKGCKDNGIADFISAAKRFVAAKHARTIKAAYERLEPRRHQGADDMQLLGITCRLRYSTELSEGPIAGGANDLARVSKRGPRHPANGVKPENAIFPSQAPKQMDRRRR